MKHREALEPPTTDFMAVAKEVNLLLKIIMVIKVSIMKMNPVQENSLHGQKKMDMIQIQLRKI